MRADRVTLELTHAELAKLHEMADGRGKKAQIEKAMLRRLLVDHHRLAAAVSEAGITIFTGKTQEN